MLPLDKRELKFSEARWLVPVKRAGKWWIWAMNPGISTPWASYWPAAYRLPTHLSPSGLTRPDYVLESDQIEHIQVICLTTWKRTWGHQKCGYLEMMNWLVFIWKFLFKKKVITNFKKELCTETHVTMTPNPGAHPRLLKSRVNWNQMGLWSN